MSVLGPITNFKPRKAFVEPPSPSTEPFDSENTSDDGQLDISNTKYNDIDDDDLTKVPMSRLRSDTWSSSNSNKSAAFEQNEILLPKALRNDLIGSESLDSNKTFQPSPFAAEFTPTSFQQRHSRQPSSASSVLEMHTPGLIDLDSPESIASPLGLATPALSEHSPSYTRSPFGPPSTDDFDPFFAGQNTFDNYNPLQPKNKISRPWSPSPLRYEQRPGSTATASTVTPGPYQQSQSLAQWTAQQQFLSNSQHGRSNSGTLHQRTPSDGSASSVGSSIRVFDLYNAQRNSGAVTPEQARQARQTGIHAASLGHARRSSGSLMNANSPPTLPGAQFQQNQIQQAQERNFIPGAGLPGAGLPPAPPGSQSMDPISSLYALSQLNLDPVMAEAVFALTAQARALQIQSGGAGPSMHNRKLGLYKTELCRSFEEKGACRYGNKCQFAHGREDLRYINRHPRYKSETCRTYLLSGTCPYGKRCTFQHPPVGSAQHIQESLLSGCSPNSLGQQLPSSPYPILENSNQLYPSMPTLGQNRSYNQPQPRNSETWDGNNGLCLDFGKTWSQPPPNSNILRSTASSSSSSLNSLNQSSPFSQHSDSLSEPQVPANSRFAFAGQRELLTSDLVGGSAPVQVAPQPPKHLGAIGDRRRSNSQEN